MTFTAWSYRLAFPFIKAYWFIFRPHTSGIRILIQYSQKFLFIYHTYYPGWNIPGGGLKAGETPMDTVIRETREETGIRLKKPVYLDRYFSRRQFKFDTVYCYFARVNSAKVTAQPSEILKFGWFDLDSLPPDTDPGVAIIIRLYKQKYAHPQRNR